MNFRILSMGDSAFTVEYPDLEGVSGARVIQALAERINTQSDTGGINGVRDLITASRSLTVCIDPLNADYDAIRDHVSELASNPIERGKQTSRLWELPACYAPVYGLDLEETATAIKASIDEVIKLHSAPFYDVLLIGFLPGFGFMSGLDDTLHFPRRKTPRTRVPAGSVAIANAQTAIYPWQSPGGWHLLARCPIPLFDPEWDAPALLTPGDRVRFCPISTHDLDLIEQDILKGSFNAQSFCKEVS